MPEIGEIRKGTDLGYKNLSSRYIWRRCADCELSNDRHNQITILEKRIKYLEGKLAKANIKY